MSTTPAIMEQTELEPKSFLQRNLRNIGIGVAALGLVTGCASDGVDPATERDLDGIDANVRDLTFEHELPDGTVIQTSYTTDYSVEEWKITSSKTLDFSLSLLPGDGEELVGDEMPPLIFVEHVHADVSLQATKVGLDGLAQDSMDDSIHGGDQPGFMVSGDKTYSDVFVIEGYSDMLISGWGFASGGTGASDISQERLNEKNLAEAGVIGNQFSFVYDIVKQDPVTGLFYKADVIRDEFNVFTAQYEEDKAAAAATVPASEQ